ITRSPPRATMPCEYMPSGGPNPFGTTGSATGSLPGGQLHVLELHRVAVGPPGRRRDPSGEPAWLDHRLHQARDIDVVVGRRQPFAMAGIPLGLAHDPTIGRDPQLAEVADGAMEAAVGDLQHGVDAVALDDSVPAVDAALAVGHVVVAQPLVQRG